ncbi:MAG: hypothetical protein IPH39_04130 [Sulfuritalea sp.]|nr:hypothetical protein [Sulfuritalea sp.]MBK9349334.1 hypothetical protein [Sulfuritalea sp.]
MASNHTKLTKADVYALGRTLIDISNRYPTTFFTERDFYPLVVAYLTGRVPGLDTEVSVRGGNIDFHMKGTNPTWLELAVQPRHLMDKHNGEIDFPGHKQKNSLYPSANSAELRKLAQPSPVKTRFLLLVDLTGAYDPAGLKKAYDDYSLRRRPRSPVTVRVIYCTQDAAHDKDFPFKC